jgi:hypothetical protein
MSYTILLKNEDIFNKDKLKERISYYFSKIQKENNYHSYQKRIMINFIVDKDHTKIFLTRHSIPGLYKISYLRLCKEHYDTAWKLPSSGYLLYYDGEEEYRVGDYGRLDGSLKFFLYAPNDKYKFSEYILENRNFKDLVLSVKEHIPNATQFIFDE